MLATGAGSSRIRRPTAVITPRPFVCEVEVLATLDRSLASEVPRPPLDETGLASIHRSNSGAFGRVNVKGAL